MGCSTVEDNKLVVSEAVTAFDARTAYRFPRELVIVLIVFAALWEIVSWMVPPFVVPGWGKITASLVGLRLDYVLITLARVAGALLISFVLGLAFAVAMYLWPSVERYGKPMVRLLMAVPVVCWILFSVLWFKWVEFRIAFVLIVVCAPVFLIDFLDGMKGVSAELRDMVRSFRPSRIQFFTKLILPGTLPIILTSWKINLSLAIRVVTIAELVGAVSGIGYGLVLAQELFSVADVFAWTFVLVVMLFLAEAVVNALEKRMLRWRA
jgi:NitT/TauT family transport system permease protein